MNGELNKKELEEVQKECKKLGIIPIKNPKNEDLRLLELNRLGIMEKNLEQDPRFSSLSEVASYLTECPYCAINILSSTIQRCKIIYGLSKKEKKDFERDEPRDLSICQFSLTNPHKPLIIENLLEDNRTKQKYNHPDSSPLRFYAGAPLISSRGFSLGTLCVADEIPKSLKHNQIEGLRILADQVVSMIENEYSKNAYKNEKKENIDPSNQISGSYHSSATIMFADFVGFTSKVENMEPGELLSTLDTFFKGFDKIVLKNKILKIKTIGDAYMCVGGIERKDGSHAKKVCSSALDMMRFVEGINIQHEALGKERWEIRIGIHSGPLIAGTTVDSFDVWGDSVNIASRLENSSEPCKIQISQKTKDYLEGMGNVTPRGEIELKNKGSWSTFFLDSLK